MMGLSMVVESAVARSDFRRLGCCLVLAVAALACLPAGAQWTSQTILLEPGWNAVFIEVEPVPKQCSSVFAGVDVESVWYWSPDQSTVQYLTDPDELYPENPDWRVYFPERSLARALTTLRVIRGNRPYLIKFAGEAATEVTIYGNPSVRSLDWVPDSYNLVGFKRTAEAGPTFDGLLGSSAAHAGKPIYRLSASQTWTAVSDPAAESPDPGEAFWVFTSGQSEYQGPAHVKLDTSGGLDFGRGLNEVNFKLVNDTVEDKTYVLEVMDSGEPPAEEDTPALAGAVPLSYWDDDYDGPSPGWTPNTHPLSVSVAAGAQRTVKLAVRRRDMDPPPAVEGEYLYQSILDVTGPNGAMASIPVTAKGLGKSAATKDGEVHPYAGLWVGTATINAVSEPADSGDPATPKPTGSEFAFQLIVHVDAAGTARLLQQVTQMWKEGTTTQDPDNPELTIIETPGEYVLLTDDSRLSEFSGSVLRGGVPVGRRVSSPAFGFSEPLDMTGDFPTTGALASTVSCTVDLDYQDPLNPFFHKYHPDHNNLDEYYEDTLDEGKESFTVSRMVFLDFLDYEAEGTDEAELLTSAYAGWGDAWLGGTYREIISGVHRDDIYVEGTFRLNFASDVTELNPED